MILRGVTGSLRCWALVTFLLTALSAEDAFAHSSDFIFARWSQNPENRLIELSLSIQISDNPNIENREQAIEILTKLMWVKLGPEVGFVPVSDIAKGAFKDEKMFPRDSPVPIGGEGLEELESGVASGDNKTEHEILSLKWKWVPSSDVEQISFLLPDESQQNVVFWWANAIGADLRPGKEIPWQIMLGGDESFPLTLEKGESEESKVSVLREEWWKMIFLVSVALGMALAIAFFRVCRSGAK